MCGVYGLPEAGALANKLLRKRSKREYFEVKDIPGLFKHKIRSVRLTLIVNDFGLV